jgi:sugar phosphate permease
MSLARDRGGLGERLLFYAMSAGAIVAMKTVRASLYTLVPILANDLGLGLPQRALLMAAFFPGYSLSQVPGGVLVQYCGGKHVLTFALGATGVLFGLLPALIRLPRCGPLVAAAALFAMGVAQGPYSPAMSHLNRAWMPAGHERIWAQRVVGLAHQLTELLAAGLTPLLCARLGWTRTCHAYATATMLTTAAWQALGRDAPRVHPPQEQPRGAAAAELQQPGKKMEAGIFRVRAAQVAVLNFVGYGLHDYSVTMFAPTIFVEALGCSAAEAGYRIALATSVNIPGQFCVGALESALVSLDVPTLSIRRWSTGAGGLLCSLCGVLMVAARSPTRATWALLGYNAAHLLHEAGCFANFLELGGEDTALLNSVANSLANVMGILVPPLGLWVRARTGSWLPHFALAGAVQSLTALLWIRYCSVTPARQLLAAARASERANENAK